MSFCFWGNSVPLFDGSEDSNVHCCKKGDTCDAGAEQLKMQLSMLDKPSLPKPFMEIDDSDTEEAREKK